MQVVIEADGGSRGNPGPAGYGAVVRDAVTGSVLAERKAAIGTETNNVAEYQGLIAGLSAAHELGATSVLVRMDSKLVIEQVSGRWQVKHAGLRPLAREATALLAGFADARLEWVPRERNKHADRLANEAMDAAAGIRSPRAAPAWAPPTGTPTRLVLVRHGATVHSHEHRFSGRNELPLDATGREQAAALAARDLGAVDAVVSSPLRRARETAEAIAAPRGLGVTVQDGLAEVDFGAWEGLTQKEIATRYPLEYAAWSGSPDVAPPGGESFEQLARRVRRTRDAVIAAHPGKLVVLVSHVTPIKTILRMALDAPATTMFRLHLDTASVSMADYYADGPASVRLVNDTSHLGRH